MEDLGSCGLAWKSSWKQKEPRKKKKNALNPVAPYILRLRSRLRPGCTDSRVDMVLLGSLFIEAPSS